MTITLPFDAITHPASKRLFRVSDLTRAQRMAVSTFVAADSVVFRSIGVVDTVIHDSMTVNVFESLPDIRRLYIHPSECPVIQTYPQLVTDVARYGAYMMSLTGQIDPEDRREFEDIVRELFIPQEKFFWPLLNSWCDVLVDLGLTRRATRELYLHDVLQEHRTEFSDEQELTPAAAMFLKNVRGARGDVALAMLNIESQAFRWIGGKRTSTTPIHLRGTYLERFFAPMEGTLVCVACGHRGDREIRAHIPNCPAWNKLDEKASRMLPLSARDLNVVIDNALEDNSIPLFAEYINVKGGT